MSRNSGFNTIYPPSGKGLLDAGLNSKYERSIIEDAESPDCLNVVFTNGAVQTRGGTTKLNTATVGTFVCDGLYTRHDESGAETMVFFGGGTMHYLNATTFITIPSAISVFTAGLRVGTAEYQNHMFIGNGGVNPYKYGGTYFTRHGVPAATGVVSTVSNAIGTLTGAYQYKITYVNSFSVEGDVGTATVSLSVTNAQISLTGIPVAPQSHGVSSRRIYRTANGGTVYKRLATLSDNTTTSYTDNIADASLGVNAPTDNGEPPKYSIVIYHQNRLFTNDSNNPNYFWYSELGEPYTFASTNFAKIGDDTSDLVKSFAIYDNNLVVLCQNSVWFVYMADTSPTNWQIVKSRSPYGTRSPFCALNTENKILFPAIKDTRFVGFATLEGNSVSSDATFLSVLVAGSDRASDRIDPDMASVQGSYVGNTSGIVFKNKAWISVTYGTAATTNNRVYLYDFSNSNLSKKQKYSWTPFTGITAAQFTIYNGNLYFGSATATGFVYQADTSTYNDDGAAINSYLYTKEFQGLDGEESYDKDFRYLNILVEKLGAYYMTVNYRMDSDNGSGDTQQVSLTPGGSLWGTMVWGVNNWNAGYAQEDVRVFLGQSRGKRIQFKFTNQNTINQGFKVHWISFTYNLKGRR